LASNMVLYVMGIAKPELGCFRRKNARLEKYGAVRVGL